MPDDRPCKWCLGPRSPKRKRLESYYCSGKCAGRAVQARDEAPEKVAEMQAVDRQLAERRKRTRSDQAHRNFRKKAKQQDTAAVKPPVGTLVGM